MTPKRPKRRSGLAVGFLMMLSYIFEPRKIAAMEQLDTANRLGRDDERQAAGGSGDGGADR